MITLEQAKTHLTAWLDASLAVSTAQSYSIGSRTLTRANISEIQKQINYWENKVNELTIKENNGKVRRAKRFMPRDL